MADKTLSKQCTQCGKKSVFFRRYEGRHLCAGCFMHSIEKRARKTIRENKMVEHGDRVAVAVSGGKDSTTLLHILHGIAQRRKDVEIFAISVDEGIKGYRPDNLKRIAKICKELGIKHHVFSFKKELGKELDSKVKEIGRKDQIREPCTYCGVGRRWVLNRKARELGATKLAMGHNLDDEVQSVMLNYMRGDIGRASRMGPSTNWSTRKKGGDMFVPRIKPLREIPEREVALYALLKGFDISMKECPYASGVRFDARDFLNQMEDKYPGIKLTTLYTFDKISPSVKEVASRDEGEIIKCQRCREPGSRKVCKTCELWRASPAKPKKHK